MKFPAEIFLPDPGSTEKLGANLAGVAPAGSLIFLRGTLGAGKTALTRGFVRAATGDPGARVLSPTFVLERRFSTPGGPGISHFDLYRIAPAGGEKLSPEILADAGFAAARAEGRTTLVEWPENLPAEIRPDFLVEIFEKDGGRVARIERF